MTRIRFTPCEGGEMVVTEIETGYQVRLVMPLDVTVPADATIYPYVRE